MKKKKLFLIPLAMFMAAGTVSLAGCGDEKEEQQQQPDDPVVAKLSSIAVKTPPTKLAYVAGESFETAGLEIEATYSDGSKKTVNGWTVDKTVLALGDSKVVVSYTEGGETKTVEIAISVAEPAHVAVLTDLVVAEPPAKTAYQAGEDFDPTGMVVEAKYDDDSSKTLNGTDYEIDPLHELAAGTDHVTISYTEGDVTKTATVAITVTVEPVVKTLTNLVIKTAPTVVEYNVGETFNPTGMVVEAKYSDGSSSEVPATDYTVSPLTALTVDDTKVTVSYTEGEVTKTVDVAISVANYGTEANPLSLADALTLLNAQCAEDKAYTKKELVVAAQVKKIISKSAQAGFTQYQMMIGSGNAELKVFKMNVTSEEFVSAIAVGKSIVVSGYGQLFGTELEITYKGDKNPACLSVVDKEIESLSNVVGPESVALNSSVALADVTCDIEYADGSTLIGVNPESIDLDTSAAGEGKTATIHIGEATATFTIDVTAEETPNQFVDAYEAAAALGYGKTTTESYNYKGIVVAKRGTEFFVQNEGYGIDVYNPTPAPAVGDLVEVNSTMQNYNGTLESKTINKFSVLESGKDLPAEAAITSAEVLGNLKQNVLAGISGTAKEDITGVSSSADYTLKLMVGSDEIPVFFKKSVAGSFAAKLNGTKAGDAISISGAVTGEFKGTKQVIITDGATVNIPRPVSSVAFEEEAYSVLVGETVTVKASVLPSDADDTAVSYSLSNPSVGVEASIDAESGVVTAGSVAGTVEVVATAHGDSTKTASVLLTISSASIPVTGVSLDKEDMTIEMKGEGPWTGSLTATVAPSDATNKNYSFSSDDESVATVTAEGVVTGLKEGKCDITVTTEDGAKTAVCHVSVIPEQPIVKEGTYTIKHVKSGTAYYMVDPNASSSPTASTNLADAAVFDFILQEGTLNQYKIKIHGENKYLYVTKSNSGLRIGNTEAVWTIANGSQATGAFDMSCSDGENTRYLTLFNTQDFRCYTNNTTNRTENTDLEAVVAKDVESIAIKQNPTKMSYYVGEAFDPTGMIVTVTFTDKTTEDITEGFTYEGSTGFQAANPDRTVKVTYKTKNAYVQHVEVKEDDRTITAIKFAEGCDMTKKEYEVGDDWDPKGLKVIAVRSDDSEFELADSDVTFTYDKTTEAAAESMTLNVTAHYVVDDSTTLDSAAKAITVVVKAKEEVEGSLYTFDPAKKTTTAIDGTKFMQALVLEDGDEIITGASNVSNTYIGASGGSGGTAWALESCLKLGKGSGGYGSVTLALDSTISFTKVKVCVLGWADTCKLKVGDIEKEFSNKAAKDNLTPVELEFNISSGESSLTIQSVYSSGNLAVLVTSIQFC